MDDLPDYPVPPREDNPIMRALLRLATITLLALTLAIILMGMTTTAGCVTQAKQIIMPTPEPTPTPEITPEPTATPEPTPTPVPTESPEDRKQRMLNTGGYGMREWVHWFRPDVQGINDQGTKDLSTWITVYDRLVLPTYTYRDFSWGTQAYKRVKPDPGNVFLFVMINIYSDMEYGDDVRQYLFDQSHFALHIKGETYYPEDQDHPERSIRELDEVYDYAHTESLSRKPYGYLVVQEKGTGAITAQKSEFLMGGRSNAEDGYIIFQIPADIDRMEDIELHASLDNLAGHVWWGLV